MCPHHMAKLAAEKLANLTNATMEKLVDHSSMDHSKMDHSTMDHSTMGHSMGEMHGMVMTFHGGYKEAILFDFWSTSTIAGFLFSCLALFVLAALYEGLKLGREKLIAYELKRTANNPIALNGAQSNITSRLFSRGHLIQTFLHMIQITVSYLLMLVFMTYNSWLCLAVVLGAGAGYFIFGVYRMTSIDVNEHCH